jgi:hypothetical protein
MKPRCADHGPGAREIRVEKGERIGRRQAFGQRRETADVGEEHGHIALGVVAQPHVDDFGALELLQKLLGHEPRERPIAALDVDDARLLFGDERPLHDLDVLERLRVRERRLPQPVSDSQDKERVRDHHVMGGADPRTRFL